MPITNATLEFLKQLKEHNTREWFNANKKRYESIKKDFELTIQDLIHSIGEFEDLSGVEVKHCNYRIARDVRFSSDKSPYKSWFSASFSQGGRKANRMDYYLHIQPGGGSFIGGGMYNATGEQLAKLRQEIDYNAAELKGIIYKPSFTNIFGEAEGASLKTTPKGYAKDHPEIELLRKTQLFFWHKFTDEEIIAADFVENVTNCCRELKPFLDFLNYIFFDENEPEVKL
ncbi:TIGR02453 family protein [Pseudarcicella hirudinis]|uniref:TIGR02453 family protein n=1 Tax=Pseudarcicella hirudinis TaxID=1079859 RepID=A0A1I5YRL1_9BACT|nr:DUF2461 domain-containing protein [Pseudarcicella hirudinis]SFQ46792.1 TIGR02453 family protein [Pseudarcicella hirudinis]